MLLKRSLKCIFILVICSCIVLWSAITKADEAKNYKKYLELSGKFLHKKMYQKADTILSMAIKKYPKAAKLYYERAKVRQMFMSKDQEAVRDYTIVIKLDSKSYPKAYWRRGLCLYNLKLYQLAIKDYSRCLVVYPKYDKVYFYRAEAYGKIGMIEKAKKDIESTVKYSPKYAPAARSLLKKLLMGRTNF